MSGIVDFYRDIKYGIKNIIKWMPIIWRDRDWDEYYLLRAMSFKMKNMSELHRKYGNSVNSEEYADQLKRCSILAERIAKNDYTDEAFGDKKYLIEKNKMVITPVGSKGAKRITFTGLTDEERAEKHRLFVVEKELLEKDLDLLFKMMRDNIKNWWD